MDLDPATIRILAAIEREQGEGLSEIREAVIGASPMTSDEPYGSPAELAASCA